jgi:glycosyltransferase involved in cell wall biosynthesis
VVVTGRVPQISDSLNTAKVFVAPVRAGNGIQFKVLQAMSCGLPVVCTPLANAGIGAKDGREIYETDDRALFAKTTLKLLEKPPLRKSMGDKARKLTQDCFTWAAVAESLESLYFGETIIAIVDATKTNESQPKVKIVKRGEEDLINNTPF